MTVTEGIKKGLLLLPFLSDFQPCKGHGVGEFNFYLAVTVENPEMFFATVVFK